MSSGGGALPRSQSLGDQLEVSEADSRLNDLFAVLRDDSASSSSCPSSGHAPALTPFSDPSRGLPSSFFHQPGGSAAMVSCCSYPQFYALKEVEGMDYNS